MNGSGERIFCTILTGTNGGAYTRPYAATKPDTDIGGFIDKLTWLIASRVVGFTESNHLSRQIGPDVSAKHRPNDGSDELPDYAAYSLTYGYPLLGKSAG